MLWHAKAGRQAVPRQRRDADRCVWGGVAYTQERNGPFQGLAADGAKLAIGGLALRGRRIIGFIHDEILEELPDQGGYVDLERVEESVAEVRKGMEEVTGGIPVSCEYTLSTCWSKSAELIVRDGKVYPWSPQGEEVSSGGGAAVVSS